MRKFLAISLVIILTGFVIYSGPIFNAKLSVSAFIGGISSKLFGNSGLEERISELKAENDRLLNELLPKSEGLTRIKVFSSYPFNSKSEIAINAGVEDGVRVGDAVTVNGNILVGRVTEAFDSSSIVTTIFSPSWEIPVRIGDGEVDALMQGGNELSLTLIQHDVGIAEGGLVIAAGQDLPYGLEVGSVGQVSETADGVFKEAVLEPGFQVKNLRDVTIYR